MPPSQRNKSKKRTIDEISTSEGAVNAAASSNMVEDSTPIMDLTEDDVEALRTSAMMVSNQISEGTKRNYTTSLKYNMAKYFKNKGIFAALDSTQSELKFPMTKQHLEIFFGVMAKERKDKSIKAKTTITSYVSAINKWGYRKNELCFPESSNLYINSFVDGYKREVAKNKNWVL
jgi:hypothetical protein